MKAHVRAGWSCVVAIGCMAGCVPSMPTYESDGSGGSTAGATTAGAGGAGDAGCPVDNPQAPTIVSDLSPKTAVVNAPSVFTVTGLELPPTTVAFISWCLGAGGVGSPLFPDNNISPTRDSATFTCVPKMAGSQTAIVKTAPGCAVLNTFTVVFTP